MEHGGRKESLELIWINLLLKLGHLQPATQAHVQVYSEWRMETPQPLWTTFTPRLALPMVSRDQSVPMAPCPATGHHGIEPGHILSAPPLRMLLHCGKAPCSLVLPQLRHPPRPPPAPPGAHGQSGAGQSRTGPGLRAGPHCPRVLRALPAPPTPRPRPCRALGGTPGRATPPQAPAPGRPRPRGSAGPERGSARLGKQTERHSSRQGKHRGRTARPLPQRTLTRGAASFPVPAARPTTCRPPPTAALPAPGPARPCRGTGPASPCPLGASERPGSCCCPCCCPAGPPFLGQYLS